MLITKVKVDKITNLSEARYCAGMGVDYLSFTSSIIDPKTYQEITGWVAGPKFGIEIGLENLDSLQNYETDFIQVNYDGIDLIPQNKKAILLIDLSGWKTSKSKLISLKEKILFLELNIQTIDDETETLIREIADDFELFIRLPDEKLLSQVLQLPIKGISLEGNAETKPGLKEYPLSEILERLDEDNSN